jgi:hypothetical protein
MVMDNWPGAVKLKNLWGKNLYKNKKKKNEVENTALAARDI